MSPRKYGPGAKGAEKYKHGNVPADVRSLARGYTQLSIRVLGNIIKDETIQPMARVAACKLMLDRGWGSATQRHQVNVEGETTLLKVVNEIVHVHETREQVEFRDQTPLLELIPEDTEGNGSKSTH